MQGPSLLPLELAYCNSFSNEDELYKALIAKPTDLVAFFELACADETWCERHMKLIRALLRWGAKMFYLSQLTPYLSKRMVKAVQNHYSILEPLLYFRPAPFFTVSLTIEGETVLVNSLLFGVVSTYFSDTFKFNCYESLRDEIVIPNVPLSLFRLIEEYILKGEIEGLWRQEYPEVLALMRLAKNWNIPQIVKECAAVLRRYIDRDNVIDTLLQAHREYFSDWKLDCYEVFNRQEWGLRCLPGREGDLRVKILNVKQETIELFNLLTPWITHLSFVDDVCKSSLYGELIRKCPKLIGADFTGSLNYVGQFDVLPKNLLELNLSSCLWLAPEHIRNVSLQFPNLKVFNLENNSQLNYLSWGMLRQFRQLISLSVSGCHQIIDSDLKLISQACPLLNEFNLEECRDITDQGLVETLQYCLRLVILNISRCYSLTDKTLVEIGLKASSLTDLSIVRCTALTDKGLWQLVRFCTSLKYLNIQNCEFSEKLIDQVRVEFPYLEIIR